MIFDGSNLYVCPVRKSGGGSIAYMYNGKELKKLPSYPCALPQGAWCVDDHLYILSGDMK